MDDICLCSALVCFSSASQTFTRLDLRRFAALGLQLYEAHEESLGRNGAEMLEPRRVLWLKITPVKHMQTDSCRETIWISLLPAISRR